MARTTAAAMAIVAGLLLMLANFRSGTLLLDVGDRLAREYLPADLAATAHLAITILLLVAGLGGLAVLVGGLFYAKDWTRVGSLFVALGAGIGVLGLVVLVAVSLASGRARDLVGWLLGPAGVGVILAILARRAAR